MPLRRNLPAVPNQKASPGGKRKIRLFKLRSVPKLFRVLGRPNSPPPELLENQINSSSRRCEFHFGARQWHDTAKRFPVFKGRFCDYPSNQHAGITVDPWGAPAYIHHRGSSYEGYS